MPAVASRASETQCPLRVITGNRRRASEFLLCPQKRTSTKTVSMSAKCKKQTPDEGYRSPRRLPQEGPVTSGASASTAFTLAALHCCFHLGRRVGNGTQPHAG